MAVGPLSRREGKISVLMRPISGQESGLVHMKWWSGAISSVGGVGNRGEGVIRAVVTGRKEGDYFVPRPTHLQMKKEKDR
ncbi:hypothetical protein WMY93_018215 [Mugilogobius chulae]|uniref:Uncharacterized protein n=1 Tax=Mugilogobius chulae TaxID=88201 RepID=A0AAW0NIH9_9GOBI